VVIIRRCLRVFGSYRMLFSLPVAGCGCDICENFRGPGVFVRR
jgi:hypothetical protein